MFSLRETTLVHSIFSVGILLIRSCDSMEKRKKKTLTLTQKTITSSMIANVSDSPDLFSEKRRLVGPISGCVASAPHGFHVGNSHTQDGQLIRFSGKGAAGGDHVWQFSYVLGHFVTSASLNFTVVLSKTEKKVSQILEMATN